MWCHFQEWWPREYGKGQPITEEGYRGVVFIISGLGEHSGRYDAVAAFLNQHGFVVFSQDNQGAGGSEGLQLYVNAFDDFVQDVHQFVDYILDIRYKEVMQRILQLKESRETAPKRLFLLGHSMGGLIAAHVAQQRPQRFGGVILSGPALVLSASPGCCLLGILHFLDTVMPKFKLRKLDSDVHLCSKNPPVSAFVTVDPFYSHGYLRAHFLRELIEASEPVWEHMGEVTFPLLIIHGGSDGLCSVEGSRRFWKEAPSATKDIKVYPNAGHEILTETCHQQVWSDVLDFLRRVSENES